MSVRPQHLSLPRATPACGDVDEALQRMADDGHQRIALWGAGDHTRRCLGALYDSPVRVACLVDESRALQGRVILGWTVHCIEDLLARRDVTAVLISSRYAPHVERMWQQRERFEAAGKTLYRLATDNGDAQASDLAWPPVLTVTVPKSGTWLLMRLLTLAGLDAYRGQSAMYRLAKLVAAPGRDDTTPARPRALTPSTLFELLPAGQVTTLHEPAVVDSHVLTQFVKTGRCKVVLLIRDPRDVVVARAHFWKHPDNARRYSLNGMTVREVMDRVILGGEGFAGIESLFMQYEALYESPHVHVVRFEQIVRAVETPSDPAATRPIRSLLDHVGISNATDARLRSILSKLDVQPYPGRSTVVDEWRTEFGAAQKTLFNRIASPILGRFGYE